MQRCTPSALLMIWTLSGCTDGASNDPAYDALMRIDNAQFIRGAPPLNASGPEVQAIDLLTNTIWPGYSNKLVKGALAPLATACALQLAGDTGYWIVAANAPDVSTPDYPSFSAIASFAPSLTPGSQALDVYAIDANAQFGPPREQTLTALTSAPSRPVAHGVLDVTLSWDTQVDLDLHVVDPLGNEIFHGAPSSQDAFSPSTANPGNPGVLQLDSNADCIIDGQRQEVVLWAKAPPSGHYLVRVDTPSLCGQNIAHWHLTVMLQDSLLGEATGVSLASDTWGSHGRGAGLLALTFDIP